MSDLELKIEISPPEEEKKETPLPPSTDNSKFVQVIQLSNVDAFRPVDLHDGNSLAEQAFASLLKLANNQPLTHTNIIQLTGATIQLVQGLKRGKEVLTNAEKKSMVFYLINRLVKEIPMDEELRTYFTSVFIPLMLSGVIDSLCDLDVNTLNSKSCCLCQ